MGKVQTIEKVTEKYSAMVQELQSFEQLIGEARFSNFKKEVFDFIHDVQQDLDESRLLRIGVVGQIKRGKSSFLNALVFDGEDVLPKAATPMTAALTKISYAPEPKAVVEYYTKEDWNTIVDYAEKYRRKTEFGTHTKESRRQEKQLPTDEERSANELLEMARNTGIDVEQYLGKKDLINGSAVDDLLDTFDQYVGSGGRFTPIVKSTELFLNIDSLKGIEIVDTPGINDPIISRGARTRQYMGRMDVVFFLSSLTQFLDQADMEILVQNLPGKGIKHIAIIGTMFDALLSEEGDKYDSFFQAVPSLVNRKKQEKNERISHVENSTVRDIFNQKELIVISSMWYNIAQHFQSKSKEEQFHFDALERDFPEISFDAEQLRSLSNIERARQELRDAADNKHVILRQRFENRLAGFASSLNEIISSIRDFVSDRQDKLVSGDMERLEKRAKTAVTKLKTARVRIESLFDEYAIESERKLLDLQTAVEQEKSTATKLDVHTGTETESYTTGWLFWKETHYTTTTYTFASVYDAVERLEQYAMDSTVRLREEIGTLIDIRKFKRDLINNIENVFDFSDDDFEPNDILLPVKNAVNRITIPTVDIDVDQHIDRIRNSFSSAVVRDGGVGELKRQQFEVARRIMLDIKEAIQQSRSDVVNKLQKVKNEFLPKILEDIDADLRQTREQLMEREKYVQEYEKLSSLLSTMLQQI